MRIRNLVSLPLCLLAVAAVAQTAPPATRQDDQWSRPAAAATTGHGYALPGNDATTKPSPFKFKSERKTWEPEPPPPRANDQDAVMGTERPWQNGQPPVSCAQTPHDPSCR
ncbi:hypothetical protein ABQJ54_05530 [Rhodanobacter sp. Si-c]|uniref:Secreted protein n=1 Tax=Rhodanobacter lycopersici TaxID=3162487 RepID=A0ABV3QBJ4_9GAMM